MKIKLTEENLEFIERQAREAGLSNSDVINIIIEFFREEKGDTKG